MQPMTKILSKSSDTLSILKKNNSQCNGHMFRQTLWERFSPLPFICSGKHTPNNNSPPHNGTCHPTEKGKLNYRLTCQSAIKLLKQNNSFSIISKLNESHFCHLEEGCLKMISPAQSSAIYVTMCSA